MRSVFKIASASAAAICFAGLLSGAHASDATSWTGCYVGVNGGYGWGHDTVKGDPTDPDGFLIAKVNVHGGLIGGQVGCNYQFADDWVVGLQGADDLASLSGNARDGYVDEAPTYFTDHAKITNLGSVTARIGMTPWKPDTLFYVKGGWAWAHNTVSNNYYPIVAHQNRSGWTLGAGVEWAASEDVSTFVEYDYYDFGTKIAAYDYYYHAPVTQTANTAIVGINYHL